RPGSGRTWTTWSRPDPRVGGRYRIAGPRAGIAVSGEHLEVDPAAPSAEGGRTASSGAAGSGRSPDRPHGVAGHRPAGVRPDSLGVCGWASTSTAWWPTSTAVG